MQKIHIIGNVGTEPEMRYTGRGKAVTNFPVAVNERYKDSEGEEHEVTTWFRVTTWGNQAEVCKEYISKGDQVYVEGKMVADPDTGGPRIWGDDEPRANFEINASYIKFLTKKDGRKVHDSPYDGEEEEKPAKKWKKSGSSSKTEKKPWQK